MIARDILRMIESLEYSVPEKIAKFYKIYSFGDISKWRSRILFGNSMTSGKKIGDWDNVGYVLIQTDGSYIIPVARSDEHHEGMDALYELKDRYGIQGNFLPVNANGNNYVYRDEDRYRAVFEKFLRYGGRDLPVMVMTGKRVVTVMSDFVAGSSGTESEETMPSSGTKIVGLFRKLTELYNRYDSLPSESLERSFLSLTNDLKEYIEAVIIGSFSFSLVEPEFFEQWKKDVEKASDNSDMYDAIIYVFSFGGMKNHMHTNMKDALENSYARRQIEAIFGNLEEAIDLFSSL